MPTTAATRPILLAGGSGDPNLECLRLACEEGGIAVVDARHSSHRSGQGPSWEWRPDGQPPLINGLQVDVCGAFVRYDVFHDQSAESSHRASAWHEAVMGWLACEPSIRLFNRDPLAGAGWKPHTLSLAREVGLRIPDSVITNQVRALRERARTPAIAKPVAGGGYCHTLSAALPPEESGLETLSSPAIVQTQLAAPEFRVFVIGRSEFTFEVTSPSLDYRVNQDAHLRFVEAGCPETPKLRTLMKRVRMDFCAADFKSDPDGGALVLLEVNTSPMFARFDGEAKGALARAMVHELATVRNS